MKPILTHLAFALFAMTSAASAATKVTFAPDGSALVNGRPFFPIGMWVYNLDPAVVADLHEHHINTVVGGGFAPGDLPLIEKHDLKCIPMATDAFVAAAVKSDSLLAWYLIDEPEEHGTTPEQVREMYDKLKAKDADHPIGITHDMLSGPPKYKGSCDFTMTDVYPVTQNRDWPLNAVGKYTDGPREVHGKDWPNFTFIQIFGGADTDGGKWAQPLPHEVRFMAFNALVHRANGILYFSYWPRAPITWSAVADINRDIARLTPWLLAAGDEVPAKSSSDVIELRAKRIGDSWLILATNSSPQKLDATITIPGLGDSTLRVPLESRERTARNDQFDDQFAAFDAKVYLCGPEPSGRRE